MLQKNKRNLLAKVLSVAMLFSAGAGVATAVSFYGEQVSVTASAAAFAETFGLEDRSWGAAEDEYYFGGMNDGKYLNTAASVSGVWNSSTQTASLKPANNGVDIMEYIYVNGESARTSSNTNKTTNAYVGSSGWLARGTNYAPVFVETTESSGLVIKMLKAYAGDTVEITFKAGFSVVDANNATLTLDKDVTYQYANGTLTKVEEKVESTVALDDKISIGSWGEAEAGITWIEGELSFAPASVDWDKATAEQIQTNNNINPCDYVLVNGKTASELNAQASGTVKVRSYNWGENSYHFVAKVSTAYAALGEFTIQYKAGLTITGADGKLYVLQEDTAVYGWTDGNFGVWVAPEEDKTIALDDKMTISSWGAAEEGITWIEGELSFVPASVDWDKATAEQIQTNNNINPCDYVLVNGKTASELNAQASGTVKVRSYNWGENSYHFVAKVSTAYAALGTFTIQYKAGLTITGADGQLYVLKEDTAVYGWTNGDFGVYVEPEVPDEPETPEVPVYEKEDVTDSVTIIKGSHNTKQSQFAIQLNPAVDLTKNGWWNIYGDKLTAANNGVDIMEYIYINGQNIRTLSDDNRTNNTYPVDTASGWLANSNQCRPAFVETTKDGVYVTVLHAFSSTKYMVTLKAGFEMLNADGKVYTITEDINFMYNEGKVTRVMEYALSFEGIEDVVTVYSGCEIGQLPAVPAVDGKIGVWALDGMHVNENTIYSVGDRTATPVYYTPTDASETLKIDDWGVLDGANYTTIVIQNNGKGLMSDYLNCWNDNGANNSFGNMSCNIMDYIYINGRSARAIVVDNKSGVTNYPAGGSDNYALNLGGIFAPVTVETSDYEGGTIYIRVLREYLKKGSFMVTVKAGFKLVNGEDVIVLNKDVNMTYAITYSGYADLATTVLPNATLTEPTVVPSFAENETHTYEFDGWYVTDVKTGEVSDVKWDFATSKVTGALTLTPKFNAIEKEKYTVTFDADNGEENATAIVYIGSYVKEEQIPTAPVKPAEGTTAYEFLYWSLDGETEYDFNTLVTGDVTLVAVYTTEVYFTATIGEDTVTVHAGTKLDKPVDPTKESTAEFAYIFDGWYNGETKWDFDSDVVMSDITLTAKFIETKRVYTITFNVTGNDQVTLNPVQVEYGTSYDLSKLLDGVDVSGYTYTIQVNGADKLSVKVIGDVTVDVTFTKKAEDSAQTSDATGLPFAGCMSTLGGVSALVSVLAIGAVALKKKED